MSHGTTYIYAPVTMPSDIAAVLGIAGTDLGDLCTSGEINMWAKYKPIEFNQKQPVTLANRASKNFGIINLPTWTNINKMANFWFGIDTTSTNAPEIGIKPIYWGYEHPTSYKRLTDFSEYPKTNNHLGYYHEAEAPIGGSSQTEYTIESTGHLRILFDRGAENDYTVKLTDLTFPNMNNLTLANMYFGILLKKSGQSNFYVVTQTTKMGDLPAGDFYVDINGLTSSFGGMYEVFPMASADQIAFTDQTAQMTNGKWIAFGEKEEIGIGATIIRVNILEQSLSAYRDISSSTRNLYVNLTLLNNVYSGGLTARVYIEVYDVNGTQLGSTAQRDTSTTIPSGGSYLMTTSVNLDSLANLRSAYSVRVRCIPTGVTGNIAETSAVATVTDGPSPY